MSPATATRPAPIPASTQSQSLRSQVVQSSLDLVFSYSRSQQLLYGKSIHSSPSFLETSSRSNSPERRHTLHDVESGLTSRDEMEDVEENDSGNQTRRSSITPPIFSSDPFDPSPSRQDTVTAGSSPGSFGNSSGEPTPRPGLISLAQDTAPPGIGISIGRNRMSSRGSSKVNFGTSASTTRHTAHPAQRVFGVGAVRAVEDGSEPERNERTPLLTENGPKQSAFEVDGDGASYGSQEVRTRRKSSVGVSGATEGLGGSGFKSVSSGDRRRSSRMSRRRSEIILGASTDGQTLFNAVAVLLGIGILSLPLAFAYAGWIGGTIMLLGFAWITCHTAKLLARLIRADGSLMGYTDIGRAAFGRMGGISINLLFCLELFALGVALIVLFGDTLEVIFPGLSTTSYKLIGLVLVLPTTLLPLHLLSLPSLLSTVSTFLLVLVILLDGLIKTSAPGSILHPSQTSLGPELQNSNWLGGIGLVLAGFGGHAVVPSLARDMRHPHHFDKVINKAFAIAAGVSFVAGAAGYLMIGNTVSDEITRDLMQDKYGYPKSLNTFALWMIAIIPLTKFGLCSRPLNLAIETVLGITSETVASHAIVDTDDAGIPRYKFLRVVTRTIVTCLCALVAIVLPGFGRVMAFLGSFSAFLICIILPLGFYMKLAPILIPSMSNSRQRVAHWMLIVVGTCMMIAGTAWAFLPGSGHGDLSD